MITFLVFLYSLIIINILIIILCVFIDIERTNEVVEYSFVLSFVLSMVLTIGYFIYSMDKDIQKCLETNKPIKAKVVYLSDSTEKIFKYTFETNLREIHVKNTEPYFHVPESLIFVEPCGNKLILKDVQ